MKEVIRDAWRLMSPYWKSEEKWKAWGLLSGVLITITIGIYFQVLINDWSRLTFDAFQNYNMKLFISQWRLFAVYLTGFLFAFMLQSYFKGKLIITWRHWMTNNLLGKWLKNETYYKIHLYGLDVDNPDQRITQDIEEFVTITETVIIDSVDKLLTLLTFSVILWQLSSSFPLPNALPIIGGKIIPGFLFWVALFYSLISTYISFRFGKTIVGLSFLRERFEANFRYSLMRIRENTESIALYHGEHSEKNKSMGFYKDIIKNMYKTMYWNIRYFLWTNFIINISNQVPFLIVSPLYFSKKIKFGGVMQIIGAMSSVQSSILHFVQTLPNLAALRAATKRLAGFLDDIECVENKESQLPHILYDNDQKLDLIKINIDSIKLPTGVDLVKDIHIDVLPGETILLSGPSGSGKSTFLRVLSGIWPFGEGKISMPNLKDVLFVPQRPYIPLGTLKNILLYPYYVDENTHPLIDEKEMSSALKKVGLSELATALNENREWVKNLSLGEQQKISFCRILLHKPKWVFLDEVTSSLDELAEKYLYELMLKEIPDITVISIAHRSTLKKFHKKYVHFDKKEGFTTISQGKM